MAASSDTKTIEVDAGLLAETREAMKSPVGAADGEVAESAMRFYLGRRALETSQAVSSLSEGEAIQLANDELHAMRRERRGAA